MPLFIMPFYIEVTGGISILIGYVKGFISKFDNK